MQDQGNFSEAERCLREALEIKRRVLGNQHPSTLVSLNNLAVLLQDQQQLAAAEPLFREAMEIKIRILGLDHPDTAISIDNLAMVLDKLGRRTEAESLLAKTLSATHPTTRNCVQALVDLYTLREQTAPGQGHDVKLAQWTAKLNELATEGQASD